METATLSDRIDKCERILKENSNSQIFAALADAYRANGDLDQAFRVCRQGLRLHPEYGAGHLVMARINFERKMYDWAEQELLESIQLDGETRASEQLRVEIMIAKGQLDKAEQAVKSLRGKGVSPLLVQDLLQRVERSRREQARRRAEPADTGMSKLFAANETKATEPVEKPKPLTLGEVLDQLAEVEGVIDLICARSDGEIVDNRGHCKRDPVEMAAFGVEMFNAANTGDARSVFGSPEQIVVETEDEFLMIMKLRRYDLVLTCAKDINLGSVRLRLDMLVERLQEN
jgi:predicted regulator of Ras-like GTPase activity (Roadblock/LC7/MglB family)